MCIASAAKFSFYKIIGLKNLYIFLQTPSFYSTSKHNRLKENLKFSKQNFRPFLSFSLFLALKNERFPPHASNVKILMLLILGYNTQYFLRPCAKLKGNIKRWNFGIGVLKQFGTTWQESIFVLFKITPPYNTASASLICNVAVTVDSGAGAKKDPLHGVQVKLD